MKGSDKVEMTINIGGEIIKLDVNFDDQNSVRDAEDEVRLYINRLRKDWPEASDKNLLAMTAYHFANWYVQLLNIQKDAIEIANIKSREIDSDLNTDI